MKKITLVALSLIALVACSKFDDSAIWEELNKHEDRIVKLETLCNQMNTNITSLQTIIIALQSNDYVVNIAPIMEGNKEIGYTITFAKSGSITIYHGKDGKDGANGADGKDGQNGTDGKDGKDGYTPKIGVKQHTDGRYYWTLDGTWLLDDNGNMIPATGEDGKDGTNGSDGKDGQNGEDGANGADGKDGITPQLKIEDGYWYLSYDNGATWQKLGKATGNNGLDGVPGADGADGEDGDSIIDSITQDEEYVYFNLSDGQILTIMKRNSTTIEFRDLNVEAICVRNWDTDKNGELSFEEASAVTDLGKAFKGNTQIVAFDELKYFTGLAEITPNAFEGCTNLWRVSIPQNVKNINRRAFYGCSSLEIIKFDSASSITTISGAWEWNDVQNGSQNYRAPVDKEIQGAFASCTSLKSLNIPASVEIIECSAFANCSALETVNFESGSKLQIIDGEYYEEPGGYGRLHLCGAFMYCSSLKEITIPKTVVEIGMVAFYNCTALESVEFEHGSMLSLIGGGNDGFVPDGYGATWETLHLGAFANCTSLKSIEIPGNLDTLENGAFYGCSSLASVTMNSPMPPVLKNNTGTTRTGSDGYFHFQKTSSSLKIIVPSGSLNTYKGAKGWKEYASKIEEN